MQLYSTKFIFKVGSGVEYDRIGLCKSTDYCSIVHKPSEPGSGDSRAYFTCIFDAEPGSGDSRAYF